MSRRKISPRCSKRRTKPSASRGARRSTARIVAIGPEVAFVDVGGKGEAMIEIDELKDEDGVLEVAAGDRIQAIVVSTEGGLKLSRKLARRAATARQLEDAFQSGLPVEGKVERAVKGGYEVRIARHRAFCPFSQIDIVRNTNPSEHEGRVYAFRIIEFKEGGKNIVVSRRVLLEGSSGQRRRHPAIDRRRRGDHGAGHLRRRVRRLCRPWCGCAGPAPCVGDGMVARRRTRRRSSSRATRSPSRSCAWTRTRKRSPSG